MSSEAVLLKCWRELPPEDQERVLKFAQSLKLQTDPTEFVPQTPLGKKLWGIRLRAIAKGMQLLCEEELEQELADRRGGYGEP